MTNQSVSSQQPDKFQDPLQNYDPKIYADPLERALAEESVAAIHSSPVAKVSHDTPVCKAIEALADMRVSCLLVEDQGKLVGVFSDRDVLERVSLEYEQVKNRPLSEVMTANPIVVYESDSAAAALSIMAVCGFRHVPVIKVDGTIVGIISPQRVTEFLRAHVVD